ncbi:MAG: polyphosphate polymerase domain-containing protein [Ardenticatenaceae bacterium]|nr:polyphosphate polymerase domain-containing protein [Ardenticatenaceae bacterium]
MTNAPASLRYELKLTCDASYLAQARTWLRLHPEGFRTAFPPRLVNSLYLDTPALNSFNANLAGVGERQKLRLRWYGEIGDWRLETDACPSPITNPTLELKYKQNLLGGKRQQVLACVWDWQRPFSHLLATIQQTADPEWQQWLTATTQPTLINRYHREYYVTVDGAIRATLDYNQMAYDQRLSPRPNLQHPLPLPDLVVIELKAAPEHSERLQWAVGRFPIPRSRNSKYVNGILGGLG